MNPRKSPLPKKITEWSVAIHLILTLFLPLIIYGITGDFSKALKSGVLLGAFSLKQIIDAFKGKDRE